MNKAFILSALTLALSTQAFSAHALSTSSTVGQYTSNVAGVTTETFASGSLPSGYSHGALYSASQANVTAKPVGSTDYFWSVGNAPAAQVGPGVITFAAPVSYFGFLWGSPDVYNTVTFYNGSTVLGAFTGSAIQPPVANGNQAYSAYFNAVAGPGESITKITFSSSSNAFETDNHSYITAVPEPETYAMLVAGLGLVGFMAKRKKSA